MFNGIVECIGKVSKLDVIDESLLVQINPSMAFDDIKIGDSVAVNGACLTVTNIIQNNFELIIVPQTQRVTNLGSLKPGIIVNLERSLKISDRLHGHNVQGHVDSVGKIISLENDDSQSFLITIQVADHLMKYIVSKGYITLDGMSITIIDTGEDNFTITLIPHTRSVTIAQNYKIGSLINIEVDILAKYVEKLMEHKHAILCQ